MAPSIDRLTFARVAAAALVVASAAAPARAQMEKRDREFYEREQFLAAGPKQGSMAPDLVLTDLDGRPQALSAWRGRVVVMIKAGFT